MLCLRDPTLDVATVELYKWCSRSGTAHAPQYSSSPSPTPAVRPYSDAAQVCQARAEAGRQTQVAVHRSSAGAHVARRIRFVDSG
eukprot:2902683-Pyramimonas_sp.AAC.1